MARKQKKKKPDREQIERERQEKQIRRVGAPRKYASALALRRAVNVYFDGISRMVPVTVMEYTGETTQKGAPIMAPAPVRGPDGKDLLRLEYLVPPSEAALCMALGIDLKTWERYQDEEKYPGYGEVIQAAKLRIKAYLLEQSMVRDKGLQGILFNLSANYGMSEKKELELGRETRRVIAADNMTMDEKLALIRRAAETAQEVFDDGEDGDEDENESGD